MIIDNTNFDLNEAFNKILVSCPLPNLHRVIISKSKEKLHQYLLNLDVLENSPCSFSHFVTLFPDSVLPDNEMTIIYLYYQSDLPKRRFLEEMDQTYKLKPFHIAAMFGNFYALKQLAVRGVDIYSRDHSGKAAAHFSAMRGPNEFSLFEKLFGITRMKDDMDGFPCDYLDMHYPELSDKPCVPVLNKDGIVVLKRPSDTFERGISFTEDTLTPLSETLAAWKELDRNKVIERAPEWVDLSELADFRAWKKTIASRVAVTDFSTTDDNPPRKIEEAGKGLVNVQGIAPGRISCIYGGMVYDTSISCTYSIGTVSAGILRSPGAMINHGFPTSVVIDVTLAGRVRYLMVGIINGQRFAPELHDYGPMNSQILKRESIELAPVRRSAFFAQLPTHIKNFSKSRGIERCFLDSQLSYIKVPMALRMEQGLLNPRLDFFDKIPDSKNNYVLGSEEKKLSFKVRFKEINELKSDIDTFLKIAAKLKSKNPGYKEVIDVFIRELLIVANLGSFNLAQMALVTFSENCERMITSPRSITTFWEGFMLMVETHKPQFIKQMPPTLLKVLTEWRNKR